MMFSSTHGGVHMDKQQLLELRQKYLNDPPEGMTKRDIKHMSDNDLLDMDYYYLKFGL